MTSGQSDGDRVTLVVDKQTFKAITSVVFWGTNWETFGREIENVLYWFFRSSDEVNLYGSVDGFEECYSLRGPYP